MNDAPERPLRVLALDGGGIRGIIPASLLAELERRCDRRIGEMFDLIAGTSTGGILALGLTAPDPANPGEPRYRAEELVNLYVEKGHVIFKSRSGTGCSRCSDCSAASTRSAASMRHSRHTSARLASRMRSPRC